MRGAEGTDDRWVGRSQTGCRDAAFFQAMVPQVPQLASGVRTVTIVGVAENTDLVHLFKSHGDVVRLPLDQNAGALREALRRVDPNVALRHL